MLRRLVDQYLSAKLCRIVSHDTPLLTAPAMRAYSSYSGFNLSYWVLESWIIVV